MPEVGFEVGACSTRNGVPYYVWILENLMHGDGCFGFYCSVQRYFPASGSNPSQKMSMRMDGSIGMRLAHFTSAELRVPQTKKRTCGCSVVWLPRKSVMERLISQINYLRLQSGCSTFSPGTEIKSRHTYTHLITVFWSTVKIFA